MKLITLNIWGGRVSEKLPDFFERHQDVDIFCFQEVFRLLDTGIVQESVVKIKEHKEDTDLFLNLKKYLPSHVEIFLPNF